MDAEQKRLMAIFDRVRTRRPDEVDGAVAELRAYVAGAPRARSSIRARYMLASALVVRADLVGGSTGLQDLAEACGLLEDLWARRLITPPDRLVFGAALAEARAKELTAWFDQVLPGLFAPMAATWEDSSPDIAIPDAGIDAGGLIAALGDPDGTRAEYIRRSDRAEAAYTVAIRLARQVGSLARPQLASLLTSLGGLARNRAQFVGESSGYDRAVETLREAIMLGDGRPTADLIYTQSELAGSLLGRINLDRQRGDRSRWTEDLFWLGQGLRWLLGQAESTPELLDDVRLKNFWHATVWGARAWIGQSLVRQDWDGAADLGLRVVALVRQLHERLAPWSVQDAMRASVAGLHDRTAFAILRRATGSAAATQVTRTAVRQALAVVEEGQAAFLSEVGQIASDEDLVAELAAAGRAEAADALARLLGDAADLERRSRDEHGLGAEFTGLHRMTGDAAKPMLADAVLANRRARAAARAEALAALAAARPGRELDVASAVQTAEATSSSWSLEATWWEVANVVAAVDRPVAYLVSLTVDDDLTVDLPAFVLLVLPPSGSRRASATAVGAIHRWLPAANFEGMVKAAAVWTDPEPPDAGLVEDMTRWLGQAVVTPTLSAAGNPGRLVIIASGMASYLPLHAARGADGRYLVETVVLESAPSARILAATRSRAGRLATAAGGAPPRRLLTVADPAGDSGGDPLPMAEPEADAVRRLLNGHGPSLTGSTATAERLRIALSALTDSTVPAVVHLACHAFANPLHPLDSALVLAPVTSEDKGVLTLSELLDVPWSQIRLVTLSACESAVPGQESPNEALSIAGALLAAGAAAVIATQRRVPDWTAAIVATRIYEEWRRTPTDLATALTNAQRWVVQAPPEEITAWCQVRIGKSIGAIGPIRAELLRRPSSWAPFMFYGS